MEGVSPSTMRGQDALAPKSEAAQRPSQGSGSHASTGDSGYIDGMRTIGIGAARLRREEAILWAILIAALGVRSSLSLPSG